MPPVRPERDRQTQTDKECGMTKLRVVALSAVTIVVLSAFATAGIAGANNGDRRFTARLRGANEVPAWITTATGSFSARLDGNEIDYTLQYNVPPEDGSVLFSHIHVGQRNVNGGVAVFLCGGGGKPACPAQ